MSRQFLQPLLNPIPFFEKVPTDNPQYNTRFFDSWQFEQTIESWQQYVNYCIPFQTNDALRLQFLANFEPITANLIADDGREYLLGNFQAKQAYANDPALKIYECDFALNIYPEGHYRVELYVGLPVTLTLQSPPIDLRVRHEHTVLLDYRNETFKDEVIFETGFRPVKRIRGRVFYKSPHRKQSLFEDMPLNQSMIKARHARLYEFQATSVWGCPDFEIDIVDRILGCSDVQIDGRYFTVSEGGWEKSEEEGYPMKGWKIEMREKLNKSSKMYIDETPIQGRVAVVINVDSKGFGVDDSGGSIYQITDIE